MLAQLVGKVVASDPDAGQPLSYSLSASNAFAIDPVTGIIQVKSASSLPRIPSGQSSVSVTLQVTVQDTGSPPLSATNHVTITLSRTAAMQPLVVAKTFAIAENNPTNGPQVGVMAPQAAYPGQRYTFALSGPEAANFRIDASGRVLLRTGVSFNFEAKSSYAFQVWVADSKNSAQGVVTNVTVHVLDVNEAPLVTLLDAAGQPTSVLRIPENSPVGMVVGKLAISDPDAGAAGQVTVALTDTRRGALAYLPATGEIVVALPDKLNYESDSNHTFSIVVTTTDYGVPPKRPVFRFQVNLLDVNEAPTNISLVVNRLPSNTTPLGVNALLGKLAAADADAVRSFTYSLVAGSGDLDNARFTLGGIKGDELRAAAPLARKQTLYVRVLVIDQGGLSFEKVLAIKT